MILLAANPFAINAQEDRPYINIIQHPDFGELMGLPGSCELNYVNNELTDNGGSLCPFTDQRYGEAGHYIIVASANTNITTNISIRTPIGDGLTYTPNGVYRVSGQADVNITAAQDQTIFSGNTGIITVILGGNLTVSQILPYNKSFNIELDDGISVSEVP